MDTRRLEQLLNLMGTDSPVRTLLSVQELSLDGSYHLLFTKKTCVVSYEGKVYLFPIEEGETADEVASLVSYMFISGDPTMPEEVIELRDNLKVVDTNEIFITFQLADELFIRSSNVSAENVKNISMKMKAGQQLH